MSSAAVTVDDHRVGTFERFHPVVRPSVLMDIAGEVRHGLLQVLCQQKTACVVLVRAVTVTSRTGDEDDFLLLVFARHFAIAQVLNADVLELNFHRWAGV